MFRRCLGHVSSEMVLSRSDGLMTVIRMRLGFSGGNVRRVGLKEGEFWKLKKCCIKGLTF